MSLMQSHHLAVADVPSAALIEELHQRGDARIAISVLRSRMPWWRRFQLGQHVWGLSGRWLAICPWNGDTAWITLPFVYFGVGMKSIELGLGEWSWHVSFEIRWRWD